MERLEFSIDIRAPREKVWDVLWDDETFRDWTSAFAKDSGGARLESDWEEGSRFEYFEGDAGSYGVIETLVPAEQVVFRHLGDIEGGEDRPSNDGDKFVEEYRLEQSGDVTTLRFFQYASPPELRDMFEVAIPRALERLKQLAER